MKEAVPNVYKLFCAVDTFGCSTAFNESSFSCLGRIDIVKRMSMTSKRLCNLGLLACEKTILKEITDEEILMKFKTSSRKLYL